MKRHEKARPHLKERIREWAKDNMDPINKETLATLAIILKEEKDRSD